MEKNIFLKKATAFTIIILFIVASFIPSISGNTTELDKKQSIKSQKQVNDQEEILVTCYNFGMPGEPSKKIEIPQHEAEYLYEKIKELNFAVASDPLSERTQQLQNEIVDLADEYDLLPIGLSKNRVKGLYLHVYKSQTNRLGLLPQTQGKASEFLCTFVSSGSGGVLPIIALPRLIPILMIPIPRLFMIWRAQEAVTSCGGLRSGTGFIAYGQQNGIALGFWGLGFTFSLPPLMGVYGLAGYSLYASVDAEYIEFYPPNSPPVISQIDPGDGEINVPLSLSELRFQISDLNGELMSYTVTTSPDIGSGSGNLKPDGVYSIPVSDLEDLTEYSWHIEVTDGMDTTVRDSHFTTEAIAPIVSNPSPQDGERYVPLSLPHLSFHLKDFQGDPMDYTVETAPDIGSGSGTGVGEGTYSIPVSGLDYSLEYIWYVNATDGEHQTNKIFNFQTEHEMTFDPFDKGWQYRKEITIDHTKVDGDLENFPIQISTTDVDLRDKAQIDGDDILFMDGTGIANRLYHEVEHYDGSSGELVAWVKVDSLSSTVDTFLYMYYGNPSCSSQQHPEQVWDSDYIMVQHMYGSDEMIYDSTINDNDGIIYDATWTTGAIGQALHFDGNSYVEFSPVILLDNDFSVSYWMKLEEYNSWNAVIGYDGHEYLTEIWPPEHRVMMSNSRIGDDCGSKGNSNNWNDGNWHHIVITREGVNVKFYYNAVDETYDGTTCPGLYERIRRIAGHGNDDWFIGKIDETRISNNARSSAWISTGYNNQNNPSGFLSFGPEEPAP